MTQTSELFSVSLVFLLLVLMVLLILCWILRHSRSRHLTELQISTGRPARILTIRTQPEQARQMLDHLLDRVFLQVEPGQGTAEELRDQTRTELEEEFESDQEASTAAPFPGRGAVKTLQKKVWKWMTVSIPPGATPPSSSANQDQTDDINTLQPSMPLSPL